MNVAHQAVVSPRRQRAPPPFSLDFGLDDRLSHGPKVGPRVFTTSSLHPFSRSFPSVIAVTRKSWLFSVSPRSVLEAVSPLAEPLHSFFFKSFRVQGWDAFSLRFAASCCHRRFYSLFFLRFCFCTQCGSHPIRRFPNFFCSCKVPFLPPFDAWLWPHFFAIPPSPGGPFRQRGSSFFFSTYTAGCVRRSFPSFPRRGQSSIWSPCDSSPPNFLTSVLLRPQRSLSPRLGKLFLLELRQFFVRVVFLPPGKCLG